MCALCNVSLLTTTVWQLSGSAGKLEFHQPWKSLHHAIVLITHQHFLIPAFKTTCVIGQGWLIATNPQGTLMVSSPASIHQLTDLSQHHLIQILGPFSGFQFFILIFVAWFGSPLVLPLITFKLISGIKQVYVMTFGVGVLPSGAGGDQNGKKWNK